MNRDKIVDALRSLARIADEDEDKVLLPVPLPNTEEEEKEQTLSTTIVKWKEYSLQRLLNFIADMVE